MKQTIPKNFRVIVPAIILVVALGIAVYIMQTRRSSDNPGSSASVSGGSVITLTADGFKPDKVTVKKGTTITFKATTGEFFWPASNLHPSHLIYPEFDPKEPIAASASWSFRFDKVGTWQFHDHIAPYYTGTITVTE